VPTGLWCFNLTIEKQRSIMKYRLIIFDFDGTLADSYPWFMSVVNMVADKYQFKKIEESEIEALRNYEAGKLLKYLRVPLWKMPAIAKYVKTIMAQDIQRIPLFNGITGLLRHLSKQGVMLAVVSSNSSENVRQVLGPENTALFKYYQCGVSMFGKSTKLKKILGQSGVRPDETLYIGDEIRDREAARQAKIAFGAVAWGYTNVESLRAHSPDMVFASIDEIAEKVFAEKL
jgi:phosphoglycolate phosphatase